MSTKVFAGLLVVAVVLVFGLSYAVSRTTPDVQWRTSVTDAEAADLVGGTCYRGGVSTSCGSGAGCTTYPSPTESTTGSTLANHQCGGCSYVYTASGSVCSGT